MAKRNKNTQATETEVPDAVTTDDTSTTEDQNDSAAVASATAQATDTASTEKTDPEGTEPPSSSESTGEPTETGGEETPPPVAVSVETGTDNGSAGSTEPPATTGQPVEPPPDAVETRAGESSTSVEDPEPTEKVETPPARGQTNSVLIVDELPVVSPSSPRGSSSLLTYVDESANGAYGAGMSVTTTTVLESTPQEPLATPDPVAPLEPFIAIPGTGTVFVPPGQRIVGMHVYHKTDLLLTLRPDKHTGVAKSTRSFGGRVFHLSVDFTNKTYTLAGGPLRLLSLFEPIE